MPTKQTKSKRFSKNSILIESVVRRPGSDSEWGAEVVASFDHGLAEECPSLGDRRLTNLSDNQMPQSNPSWLISA